MGFGKFQNLLRKVYLIPFWGEIMNNQQTITVGIPTYHGGPVLLETVRSIYASRGIRQLKLLVSVDGRSLHRNIKHELENLDVEIIENKERKGQIGRIKQLIKLTETDLIVLTQDDVKFNHDTLAKIVEIFDKQTQTTMVSARLLPMPAETLIERLIETGMKISYRMGESWRDGDNYLLASGRCLAFRTKKAKEFTIPDNIINSDAYLYFENKKKGGKFSFISNATVFNKSPQKFSERLKKSKRFQLSKKEISPFINVDANKEYSPPLQIKIRSIIMEFFKNPFLTIGYLGLFIYTRLPDVKIRGVKKPFWETDISTKNLSSHKEQS